MLLGVFFFALAFLLWTWVGIEGYTDGGDDADSEDGGEE